LSDNCHRLDLLGTFGLFTPSGQRIEISSRKAIALVAMLALSPGGTRGRKWLQTMLWGTREDAQAQSSLRRELSTLAQLLNRHGAGDLLIRNNQRVGLVVERLTIDVDALGTRLPDPRLPLPGDLLEGLDLPDCEEFEDWLRDERNRLAALAERLRATALPPPPLRDVLGRDPPGSEELLTGSAPQLPPKPSVAVLPLVELTASGGWLGLAIADEIGVILSQYPQLFIVASSAARSLAGSELTRPDIARRLGVRYLVEGTVVQVADRLRVMVALVDGSSGEQLWGETFAGTLADMFDMQREIAGRIAPQIWTKVDSQERRWSLRRTGPPTDRYDLYWRANALFRSWQPGPLTEAVELAETLVARDPACPWATSLAGFCHSIQYMMGYAPDPEACRRRAIYHYQTAIRHGEDNVEALGYAAGTLINLGGELAIADRLIAQALNLLPAHQPTLFWGGWVDIGMGNAARARERFQLAMRINPATGARGQTLCGIGFADLQDGRPDDAAQCFRQALVSAPEFRISELGLCVAAMLSGDSETAVPIARRLLADGRDPPFLGLFQPQQQDLLRGALRQAAA
jgi:TolB-like protein